MTSTVAGQLPRKHRKAWVAPLIFVGVLAVIALAAPIVAPYQPNALPSNYDVISNKPPTMSHPFGTDSFGRDVLSRVIHGSQVSLALSIASVTLALILGTGYGALSGMVGGLADRLLMRMLDVALSIPRLLLLLAVSAFWQGLSLVALVVLLGTTGWFDVARLVRGEVQSLRQQEFMQAAVATGVPRLRVFLRHVLPHLIPLLVINASINVAGTIALEAGLSYLGLGVQPPFASWGTILNEGAGVMATRWWLTLFPGLAVIVAVLACHALGDALRDEFSHDQVPA